MAKSTVGTIFLKSAHQIGRSIGAQLSHPTNEKVNLINLSLDLAQNLVSSHIGHSIGKKVADAKNIDHDSFLIDVLSIAISKLLIRFFEPSFIALKRNINHMLSWLHEKWDHAIKGHHQGWTVGEEVLHLSHTEIDHHHRSRKEREKNTLWGLPIDIGTSILGSRMGRALVSQIEHHYDIRHEVALKVAAGTVAEFSATMFKHPVLTYEMIDHTVSSLYHSWHEFVHHD